jgi:hypothetical protein
MLAALVLAAAESLVANRHLSAEREPEERVRKEAA